MTIVFAVAFGELEVAMTNTRTPGTSAFFDPGSTYVTGVSAGIVMFFVPLGKTIVIFFWPAVELTVLTVELAIIRDVSDTVLTVAFAIICLPALSILVNPSPVPRSDGAKM